MAEKVPMPASMSNRTDNNNSARVNKIQNDAKIQNASGGAYGSRQGLQGLAQGASTAPTGGPAMSLGAGGDQGAGRRTAPAGPPTDMFAPTNHGKALSDGAPTGPGANSTNQIPVDSVNQDSILARAMLALNPESQQLNLMVEMFNEMENQ